MLLWIFIILFEASVACLIAYNKKEREERKKPAWKRYKNDAYEWLSSIGWPMLILSTMAVAISMIFITVGHASADATIAKNQERYKSLTYQLENDLYDNDNDIGKKALYDEIREYNEELAHNRELQDNFWIGIYYPDVWDQLEFIDYPSGK